MDVGGIIAAIVLVILTPGVPAAVIYLRHSFPERTSWVEPLITCYVMGIAVGNIISLSGAHGEGTPVYTALDLLSSGTVALGLPMLLFSTNLAALRGPAVYVACSMLIGATCVVCCAFAVDAMVGDRLGSDAPTVGGLMTAVLTGGTPNMAAVRAALGIPAETFVAVHTAETVVGAVYVLLLVTVARRGLGMCMRDYEPPKPTWFGGYCACLLSEPAVDGDPEAGDQQTSAITASTPSDDVSGNKKARLTATGNSAAPAAGPGTVSEVQMSVVKTAPMPTVEEGETAGPREPYYSLEEEASKRANGLGKDGSSGDKEGSSSGEGGEGQSTARGTGAASAGGKVEEAGVDKDVEDGPDGDEDVDDIVREMEQMETNGGVAAFMDALDPKYRCGLLQALGLAVVIIGVSFAIGLPAGEGWSTVVTIVAISTFALVASAFSAVRNIKHTFTVGEFVVLGFCFAVGALADLRQLVKTSPFVFLFVAVMMVLAIGLHILIAGLMGFDADTVIISSVSNVLSPPFVGLACRAIGNRKLMAPGVTAGLLGYAVGSYLGIGVFAALGGTPNEDSE